MTPRRTAPVPLAEPHEVGVRPSLPKWHILTCEYPPSVGGISDYARSMAEALVSDGAEVHVWCPRREGLPSDAPGISVHGSLERFRPSDLCRTGRSLNACPKPRQLFVQWVPHGYGYKSLNLPFAAWLAWRAWVRGDQLHLMVHEPFMRFSRRPVECGASIIHRMMFAMAGSGATRIWLSISTWGAYIRPLIRRSIPVAWLPVPAPALESAHASAIRRIRGNLTGTGPLIGHFSTHSPVVTRILAPVVDEVLRRSDAGMLFIGRESERFRRQFLVGRAALSHRVHAAGVLDARALSEHIQACDVMLQPFPDGISARHTSALASIALGRPIVTNSGPLTEALWREEDAVVLAGPEAQAMADAVLALLADGPRRERLADAARSLYERVFDVRHAVSMLHQEANVFRPVPVRSHAEA